MWNGRLYERKWSFVNKQLDAEFFFLYLFIPILYMFRATKCSSSGESIVPLRPLVYVTVCRWPCGMQVYMVKNCTLVQALRLCTGRGIALLFLDHGTRREWGVSVTPRPLFTPGKDPVPIVQEAGWSPGPLWTGADNLVPTGIRSPGRTARSQSLYRLSYPAPSLDGVPSKPVYHTVTYEERYIPEVVLIQLTLLMMSTWLLETCRELE